MKIDSNNINNHTNKNNLEAPLLTLVPSKETLTKSNSTTFELRINPADAGSPTHKETVRILNGTEDVRTIINWHTNLDKCWGGLGYTNADGVGMSNVVKRTLTGPMLHQYKSHLASLLQDAHNAAKEAAVATLLATTPLASDAQKQNARDTTAVPAITGQMVVEAVKGTIVTYMPYKVKPRVKRWLRYQLRKPADMSVRSWYTHVQNINEHEIPALPPFNERDGGKLPLDELKEILLLGCPKSWQTEMTRQGFDTYSKSIPDMIRFFEQLEAAEAMSGKPTSEKDKSKKTTGTDPKKKKTDFKKKDDSLTCPLHGAGHSEEQCRTIKKMKKEGTWNGPSSVQNKNKTWSRKADEAKKATKKELATFIQKTVAKSLRKELNVLSKKRKKDDDEESVNLVEDLLNESSDDELKDFNYADLEGLNLDSDSDSDEVSV